jgi:hypothetical protein
MEEVEWEYYVVNCRPLDLSIRKHAEFATEALDGAMANQAQEGNEEGMRDTRWLAVKSRAKGATRKDTGWCAVGSGREAGLWLAC